MQLSSRINVIAALIITASTLVLSLALSPDLTPQDAVATIVVVSFKFPECTQTSACGSEFAAVHTAVPVDNCTAIAETLSFQTFFQTPCPSGYMSELIIYQMEGCLGEGVVEIEIDPDSDACVEDPVGGTSALFQCVDS